MPTDAAVLMRALGVDGQSVEAIEAYGVERWLGELAQTLRDKTYRAASIRRSYISKSNGQPRPLGIATIWDRLADSREFSAYPRTFFILDSQPGVSGFRSLCV